MTDPVRVLPADEVDHWDREHDVVVVGFGGAGAGAAIESARAGADTVVLERMTRGGGTTALCTGVVYFGGGTALQKACGFDDSVAEMTKHVRLAAGEHADEEKVRRYCEDSVEHFDWFRALGVEFKESFVAEKTTHPFEDDGLYYSGNELVYPFADRARPAPRGHKPARPGEAGGYLMECLIRGAEAAGARIVNECRVERLVQAADRRVVGVVAHCEGQPRKIKARRGVILCAGGFVMNEAMLAEHAPSLLRCNWKAASPGDDGLGIRLGMGAGAETANMGEGLVLNAYYPPGAHLKGILVDARGQRFINEDAYLGRTADAMLHRADGRVWLIVDDELYGRTQAMHKLAAVEESFTALECALDMPEGELVRSIAQYNRHAEQGRDPDFHKAAEYCRPLSVPPYAALDCTVENSIYGVLTLGGLSIRATGQTLDPEGEIIPGLYAAGRNSAGLTLEGRTYASGLSVGEATYFGRVAGRHAAALDAWE
ncbi:MAG: FAD-dependent oxidoreductase [Deltaproteobacteria bacterium]|nr:FAD-dependent oxidoreductase [Deltaproteobacteria bacterium]MBW2362669.1 FAD-dependent oxidoreductase [Deltaproteobacteria bacterium]